MRGSFRFYCVLTATLWAAGGLGLQGQAQTEFPQCREDGSSPAGEAQCGCELRIFRGDHRNPKPEYQVHVPEEVAEIGGCSWVGTGFRVSLTHPHSGEVGGDYAWSQIWVSGAEQTQKTFQWIIDYWPQEQREDSVRDHATDLQIDPPERTFLSSLPALHLRLRRKEPDRGSMVYEVIIANNPHKAIVYELGMASPAEHYEKNEKLFKAVVEGFSYVPHPEK